MTGIVHDFRDGTIGWTMADSSAGVVRWLGRDALMLAGAKPAIAPFRPSAPYTLQATVSGGSSECYVGLCFHLKDWENFELIYLAPHVGDGPDAIQYDPVIRGSNTWQIFGDGVGLWAYLPAYVADFEVSSLDADPPITPKPKVRMPAGTVEEWLVGLCDEHLRRVVDVQMARVEHNGSLCLNRFYSAGLGARALAACDVDVPRDSANVYLELGYSDEVRVWLDDGLVYEGQWIWDPGAGTDGRIRPDQERILLPSEAGKHRLVAEIAATEPAFGWGITARVVADDRPCQSGPASELWAPSTGRFHLDTTGHNDPLATSSPEAAKVEMGKQREA